MFDSTTDAAQKFDVNRAAEYETQSRIALAGYDACHELAACLLAAVGRLDNPVNTGSTTRSLCTGGGTTSYMPFDTPSLPLPVSVSRSPISFLATPVPRFLPCHIQ